MNIHVLSVTVTNSDTCIITVFKLLLNQLMMITFKFSRWEKKYVLKRQLIWAGINVKIKDVKNCSSIHFI